MGPPAYMQFIYAVDLNIIMCTWLYNDQKFCKFAENPQIQEVQWTPDRKKYEENTTMAHHSQIAKKNSVKGKVERAARETERKWGYRKEQFSS